MSNSTTIPEAVAPPPARKRFYSSLGHEYAFIADSAVDPLLSCRPYVEGSKRSTGRIIHWLVGTLSVIPAIPVAGMALILGIDRFMSMFRALVNMIGNGVATLVVARWENELDRGTLQRNLA